MTDLPLEMSEVFFLVCELGYQLGVRDLGELEEPWVHRVNNHWTVAVNGSSNSVRVEPEGTMGAELLPMTVAVWWHGWLAGLVGVNYGTISAHPEGANEERLIEDLRAAIEEVRS